MTRLEASSAALGLLLLEGRPSRAGRGVPSRRRLKIHRGIDLPVPSGHSVTTPSDTEMPLLVTYIAGEPISKSFLCWRRPYAFAL